MAPYPCLVGWYIQNRTPDFVLVEAKVKGHYRKRPLCRVSKTLSKGQKHSANALPSVALSKGHTEEKMSAKGTLPSAYRRALGKVFAERKVPRSAKFKRRDGAGT
jgi:hypothetical protein